MAVIAGAAVAGLTLLVWSFRMQREVRRPPRCGKCGYSMESLEKLECPECGHRVASLEEWSVHRPKWGRRAMRIVAVVMLVWVVWMLSYVVGFVAERGRLVTLGLDRDDNFKGGPVDGIPVGIKWEPNATLLAWPGDYRPIPEYLTPTPWSFRIRHAHVFAPVTDKDMEVLCAFPMLENLTVNGSKLTDVGLSQLKNARAVESLDLGWDFPIDDHKLEFLSDMPALKHLELIGTRPSKFGGGGRKMNCFVRGPGLASLKRARSLWRISLTDSEIVGDDIRFLAEVPNLEYLILCNTKFSDHGLKNFKLARSLKWMDLRETETGDVGVPFLGAIPGIESLDLSSTKIKGPGLAGLKNAQFLKSLSLRHNDLDEDCIRFLAEIPRLECLSLQHSRITSAGISALKNAPALQELDLYGTAVDDDSLGSLADIRTLKKLGLEETQIQGAGLAHFKRSNIEELNLGRTSIGDDCIDFITAMPKLQKIWLNRTHITEAGFRRLLKGSRPHEIVIQVPDNMADVLRRLAPGRIIAQDY